MALEYITNENKIIVHKCFTFKVVHDCRNDSAALYFQYDILVKGVFDTQVNL